MKRSFNYLILVISITAFNGCATIFKGYEEDLVITNAPDSIQVMTMEGVNLPVSNKTVKAQKFNQTTYSKIETFDKELKGIKLVRLPSKKNYVLVISANGQERKIQITPKLGLGWFLLDVVCLGLPVIPDMITGNWNYYDPINFSDLK